MTVADSAHFRRLIAIGDIHGKLDMLNQLLESVAPTAEDRLVFLGDYVDRGPDSCGVIECLQKFQEAFPQTVFIRGNHDQMFLDALVELGARHGSCLRDLSASFRKLVPDGDLDLFLYNGGSATLHSYANEVPADDIAFFEATRLWWRQDPFIFVHAGVAPDVPLEEQDPAYLLWERHAPPGRDGVIHVVGHSPTRGKPRAEPGRFWLDTGAVFGGTLTACDVLSQEFWQVSPGGQCTTGKLAQ